ncbi:hypothetical protein Syun_010438 [Stephania yunnanensis]|uniref:Uncharacterized protein n=1 Tax=Stephania yunnanensis TaxID=152371 RepID=A0AAP0KIL2_9MAGN
MMSSNEQMEAAAAAMTSSRGVRKNAKVMQKRIPQRGLGVAQLERLRLEERWKKMTEQKRRSEAAMLSEHIAGFNQEKMMRNHLELMRAPAMTMTTTTSNQGSDRFLELALGSQTSRPMMNGNLMINKPAEFCSSFGPKEIEVMGVHRKINNNNNNYYNTTNNMGSVIREYNFFPTHNGNNSTSRSSGSNKDYHNQYCSSTITSVRAEATEGSPVVLSDQLEPSYTTNTDTKCLDLSLKLSCYT